MEVDTKDSPVKNRAAKKADGRKSEKNIRSETAKQLGIALTNLRNEYGLTQAEFSEKIGLSQAQFSALEAGKYSLSYATMDKISEALEIDPIVLVMRLFAEGLVLKGLASGVLDINDFKEIGDEFVTKIKERCQNKFQSNISSNTSLSTSGKPSSLRKRTTIKSKQMSK